MLAEFIETVDQETELLNEFCYRLTILKALVVCDTHESIPRAVRDTESVYEQIKIAELVRSSATIKLIDELGLDPESAMDIIAKNVPDAWGEIILDRRTTMLKMLNTINSETKSLSESLSQRINQSKEALDFIGKHTGLTYGKSTPQGGMLVTGAI